MGKYNLSKYNVFKHINDTVVGANLNKRMLFAIDAEKFKKLQSSEDSLDLLEKEDSTFFSTMCKLGVIRETVVDNTTNKSLLLKNRVANYSSVEYRLTINPTLNCNFSCWYCYETRSKKKMEESVISATLKYIQTLIDDKRMSVFYLDWFGGEPLMCYNTVMKSLALKAKEMCEKNGVYFESGITTNGYLINEEVVSFFKDINMQSLQITLDGDRETHNGIRFQKNGQNSYDKIVENITLLATELKPENLALRINFTVESFNGIASIIDSFPISARGGITILLQQVWQDADKDKITLKDIEETKLKFEEAGFQVDKEILNLRNYTCYADKFNQAVINYDGRVFKCTARNFEKETEDGILTEDGHIEWSERLLPLKIAKATFENDECMECKYLPVCFGPCSQKMFLVHLGDNFNKYCFKLGIESTLDYIMTEFEKSDQAIAPILNYRK